MNPLLNTLIVLLCRSIGQRKLYFSDHQIIKKSCKQFIASLRSFLNKLDTDSLFIGIVDDKLIYDGNYLVGPSIMGAQLIQFAGKLQCGGLIFGKETQLWEMKRLLDLTVELKEPVKTLQEARKLLEAHHITNIELAAHYTAPSSLIAEDDQVVWQGKDSGAHLYSPLLIYQALFDVVAKAFGNVSLNRSIDINSAVSVSEHLLSSTRINFTDMLQLVRYPDHDSYTVGHSVRVATLAVFVAARIGVEEEQLVDLGTAALLHDVGKSTIPTEILFKAGRLDKNEFAIIKSHALAGAEILLEHRDTTPLQVAAAWGHHIRYDGKGYPEMPSWAVRSRIVSLLQICDVFEALTAVRPYKPAITPLSAYGIMVNDKGAFDPSLLFAFISSLGIYPPGNEVGLTDGCLATVVATGSALDKPIVRIIQDFTGTPIPVEKQRTVDLSKGGEKTPAVAELLVKKGQD